MQFQELFDPQSRQLGLDKLGLGNQLEALKIQGIQRMYDQQDAMMKARAAAVDPTNILQSIASGNAPQGLGAPGMPQGPIGAPAPPMATSDAGPSFPPMGAGQAAGAGGAPSALRVDPTIEAQKKSAAYYDQMMKAVAPYDIDGKQTEIYANARDKALTAIRQSETEARKEEVGKLKDMQGWMGAIKDQDTLNSVAKLANAAHPGALDELGFPKVNGQYVWTPDVQKRADTLYQGTVDAVQRAQIEKGIGELQNQKANTAIAAQRAAQQKLDEDRRAAQAQQEITLKKQTLDPFGNLGINKTGNMGSADAVAAQGAGDQFLSTLPATQANVVKALAEGRQQFPAGAALRNPYWQGMLQMVAQYDPSFDAVNYNARAKMRQDATSGKMATTNNAINTVGQHLEKLSDSANALNNSSFGLLNSVKNSFLENTGDPRVDKFNTDLDAVSNELERVYRGTGGSAGGIQAWKDKLSASKSPAQMNSTILEMKDLLEGKINANADQYKQGMGTTNGPTAAATPNFVSPKTKQVFEKLEARAKGAATTPQVKFLGFE